MPVATETSSTIATDPEPRSGRRFGRVAAALAMAATLFLAACSSDASIDEAVTGPTAADEVAEVATEAPIPQTTYNTETVDDVEVFYRESGEQDAPVVLLLHGFPTSSHMFRNLIPELADDFRVIAPDLVGFGSTVAPEGYDHSFDNMALVVEGLVEQLNIDSYAIYLFDYGAPVGFRLAEAHPERVTALITQNGNAYVEGLSEGTAPLQAYWADPSDENRANLEGFLAPETTQFQYVEGTPEDRLNLISPEAIAHTQANIDRDRELQLDLFLDYQSNVELYPSVQEYLRTNQPPVLAVWAENDPFFIPAGAEAFLDDVPDTEIHLIDAGHFAVETHGPEIAELVTDFLDRVDG